MGIENIGDLKSNPSVKADEPTVPPTPENTAAGKPSTPIDNVAREQAETQSDDPETGEQHG